MEENITINNENIDKRIINRKNIILLVCCLVLGILFEILFYGKLLGISYPLFILAFYGILLWNLREKITFELNFAWMLSIPILALSFTYFIYSNVIFMILNFIAVPVLIIIQTTLITGNNKYDWYSAKFIKDICKSTFIRPFSFILKPFEVLSDMISQNLKNRKISVAGKVFAGLVISIPLVILVVVLLSSADQIFKHFTGSIFNFFYYVNIQEFTLKAMLVLLICFLSFSYLWSLSNFVKTGEEIEKEVRSNEIFDKIIIITVLCVINLIYMLFVFIQFTYLFGGSNFALPQNFTHSEYARRGFFELVAVTLINLGVLLGGMNSAKQASKMVDNILRILNSILVICTFVMLYSAHFRMSLYEQIYGYTYLRVLTHAFMIFIFFLLLVSLYKVWNEKFLLVKAYIVIAIIAYIIVNYANVDVLIAHKNYERYQKTRQIDVWYLGILSYDAVPWLIELMHDKNKDVAVEAQNILVWKKKNLNEINYWQSFNISRYNAKYQLSKHNLKYKETGHER